MTSHYFTQNKRIYERKKITFNQFDLEFQLPSLELIQRGVREGKEGVCLLFNEQLRPGSKEMPFDMQNVRFLFIDVETEKKIMRLSKVSGDWHKKFRQMIPKINDHTPVGAYEFGNGKERKVLLLDFDEQRKNSNLIGWILGDEGRCKETMRVISWKQKKNFFSSKSAVSIELILEFGEKIEIKEGKFRLEHHTYIRHEKIWCEEFVLSNGFKNFQETRKQAMENQQTREFYNEISTNIADAASKVPALLQINNTPKLAGIEQYGVKMALLHRYAISVAFGASGSDSALGHVLAHNERALYHAQHSQNLSQLAIAIGDAVPIPTGSTQGSHSYCSDSGSNNSDGHMYTTPSLFRKSSNQMVAMNQFQPQNQSFPNQNQPPNQQNQYPQQSQFPHHQPYPPQQPPPQHMMQPKPRLHAAKCFTSPPKLPPTDRPLAFTNAKDYNGGAAQAFDFALNRSIATPNIDISELIRTKPKPYVVFQQPANAFDNNDYQETMLDGDGDTMFANVDDM